MSYLSRFGLAIAALLLAPAALGAQSSNYQVQQGGKQLGTAQYTSTPVQGGFHFASSGSMKLGTFSYSFKNDATVDSAYNFVRDTLSGSVNGKTAHANDVTFQAGSDSTGRNILIEISGGGGANQSNTVDRHRNLVMVPDLDPAAYALMVRVGLTQPRTAWVLIPKQEGLLVPANYGLEADLHGTLGGAPVTVKHLTATVGAENALTLELFATADGQLLEADLDEQNLQVVRDGFVLADRPKPTVPAQAAAPPPGAQPTPPPGAQTTPQTPQTATPPAPPQ